MCKSGDDASRLGDFSVPVAFVLHVGHLINVGFNSAWLFMHCVVMSNFIVEGGRMVGSCDGDCVDVAIRIG